MLEKIWQIPGEMNLRNKLFLIFIGFDLVLSIVISIVLFRVSYDKFFKEFIDQKVSLGYSLSREMDADVFPGFTHPDMLNDPDFEYFLNKMKTALRDEKYVHSIYSLLVSKKGNHLSYAVDGQVNQRDSILIENEYLVVKFYINENGKPVLYWNNKEYSEDFVIQSNGERFHFQFDSGDFTTISINEEKILTVLDPNSMASRTPAGILDMNDNTLEIEVPAYSKSKEIHFQLHFQSRGHPSFLPGWTFFESEKMKFKILQTISTCKTSIPSTPELTAFGYFFHIIIPIFGNENKCIGALVMSLSPENISNFRNSMLFATIWISVITFVIALLISYWISGLFVAPLNKLTYAVQELSSGNMETGVAIHSKDEFGFLASKFNEMVINLKRAYEDSLSLASIRNELMIAKQIQESILPRKIPESAGISMSINYIPMAQVGGDFYDFYTLSEKKLGVFIADVSGHGIPAAIIASMLKVAFSVQSQNTENPAKTLEGINKIMFDKCGTHFITACYVFIDLTKKKLTLAKAGHPPLIIFSPSTQTIKEYKSKGRLMGVYENLNSANLSIKLQKKDRLFLFTDGVMEVINEKEETFGEENFKKFILQNSSLTPDEFQKALMKELLDWKGNPTKELPDDICLIVMDVV
jgi:serine phosphatase RsbU (regulator of sigma subunit)